MVVPPTPLHTSRVLTEDKELWDDVKVRLFSGRGHKVAIKRFYRAQLVLLSLLRRNWPVPWPPCAWTTTRWRSKTWTHRTTRYSTRDARDPWLQQLNAKEMGGLVTATEKQHFLSSNKKKKIVSRGHLKVSNIFTYMPFTECYCLFLYINALSRFQNVFYCNCPDILNTVWICFTNTLGHICMDLYEWMMNDGETTFSW